MLQMTQLVKIVDRPANDNMVSFIGGLAAGGQLAGLNNAPHRLAQYVAQVAHETARFRYDREVWDGKGAQARYDTRTDLGNTPERDGDGFKYRGRTGIQITGKANYQQFTDWARRLDPSSPDFVADPDAANTDPWEGLGPIWYWDSRSLNRHADTGNNEMITRRINGGLNGYDDRLRLYDRAALVLLGYGADDVRGFQMARGLAVDGVSGPMTRAAMHSALLGDVPSVRPASAPDELQGLVAALRELADKYDPKGKAST
jgi:putative chitinase|tara:strand:+ start:128 stop:904 length:777 start_codon:yes stop_codon:yes gene_type:complete